MLVARTVELFDPKEPKRRYTVTYVERKGNEIAAGWEALATYPDLLYLVAEVDYLVLKMALDGSPQPLLHKLRMTPKQSLERLPERFVRCRNSEFCSQVCGQPTLSKLKCVTYLPTAPDPALDDSVGTLFAAWRRNEWVVVANK